MARSFQAGLFSVLRQQDEFERFWFSYPRKKSKGDALKAWDQTAHRRPSIDRLMLALGYARIEWRDREPDCVPYPATWLRAHGWEDEPDVQVDEAVVKFAVEQEHLYWRAEHGDQEARAQVEREREEREKERTAQREALEEARSNWTPEAAAIFRRKVERMRGGR